MKRRFADNTEVPVLKSQYEIQSILLKYGADEFASGFDRDNVKIGFMINGRRIRITFPMPDRNDHRFTHYDHPQGERRRKPEGSAKAFEDEVKRMWRAVTLVIKAKLEAVESNITTFDQEFLPFIVMPDGRTIAEILVPQLPALIGGDRQLEDLRR